MQVRAGYVYGLRIFGGGEMRQCVGSRAGLCQVKSALSTVASLIVYGELLVVSCDLYPRYGLLGTEYCRLCSQSSRLSERECRLCTQYGRLGDVLSHLDASVISPIRRVLSPRHAVLSGDYAFQLVSPE